MNYGHLFGPFVIYKMWLVFKRANKIHVLLFIVHFHVPIFVIYKMWLVFKRANKIHVLLFIVHFHVPIFISFNHRTTHQPRHPKQCKFGPI
jgi:hypothetical protein